MKSILKVIKQNNTLISSVKRLIQIIFLLAVFSIPFSIKLNNALVIALSLLIFAGAYLDRRIVHKIDNKKILIFSFLYFIQVIGLLYTENFNDAKHQLEVKFPILLFPIIFSIYIIDPGLKKKALKTFLLSCNLVCLLALYLHFKYFLEGGYPLYKFFANINYLVHTAIPKLSIHPVYLSSYLLFAFVISYYSSLNINKKVLKYAHVLNMLFLAFFILILSSRVIFLTLFLIVLIILFNIIRKKSALFIISTFLLTFILFSSILTFLPITKNKLADIYTEVLKPNSDDGDEVNGVSNRLQKWTASGLVIKENFFLGVGTGDADMHLLKAYEKINFQEGIIHNYNAHNEYIQEFIRHGILGISVLLALYVYSIVIAIKRRDKIHLYFMLIIITFSFTESILSLQKGVIFFAFFNSLFAFCDYPKRYKTKLTDFPYTVINSSI